MNARSFEVSPSATACLVAARYPPHPSAAHNPNISPARILKYLRDTVIALLSLCSCVADIIAPYERGWCPCVRHGTAVRLFWKTSSAFEVILLITEANRKGALLRLQWTAMGTRDIDNRRPDIAYHPSAAPIRNDVWLATSGVDT